MQPAVTRARASVLIQRLAGHRRGAGQQPRRGVQRTLAPMTARPAFIRTGRLDLLGANRLGYALYSPVFAGPARPANLARFQFLDPRATGYFQNWDEAAHSTVA